MSKPIVIAVDPFREDPDPLAFAAVLSELTGRRLVAVGAYLRAVLPGGADIPPLRDLALEGLQWARDRLPEGTDTVAVPGESPPRALLEAAEEHDAALLVVGATRRGPAGHLMTGSVTDHLLHGATCPVAVVPQGYHPPRGGLQRVGAAYVDTPEGRAALTGAIALARRAGASLRAVTVVHPIGWGTMAVPMATAIAREQQETRRMAKDALDHALEGLEPSLAAEPVVIENGVGGALAAMSSDLDVLVCGSRGYGPVKSVVLGSVSHALSRHSVCPLIVLPRGSARELEELVAAPAVKATR